MLSNWIPWDSEELQVAYAEEPLLNSCTTYLGNLDVYFENICESFIQQLTSYSSFIVQLTIHLSTDSMLKSHELVPYH